MTDTPSIRRRFNVVRLLRVLIVVAVAADVGLLIWLQWFKTYHLVVVDSGKLYRDGIRNVREFRTTLRKTNPKTIVTLLEDEEMRQPEFVAAHALARSRGMEVIWIPIPAGEYPSNAQLRQFLTIANDPARQPVLLHDDEGIRRAGMLAAAYQESILGYDDKRAVSAMRAFGHSDRTMREIRLFIETYDPVAGLPVNLNNEAIEAALLSGAPLSQFSATRPTAANGE